MRLQSDQKVRVVALDNLRAMCARVSGMAHRFSVVKVSRSRVHVEYSNPDEWGREHPFVAVFPCYPSSERNEDRDNPCVVLSMMRTIGEPSDYGGEGWQAFAPVLDCPTLWRGIGEGEAWKTHRDLVMEGVCAANPRDTCTVCDLPTP